MIKKRKVTTRGYIRVYAPDHPRNTDGFVYEHTIKMEKKIGRYLRKKEVVHHKNHDKGDNRLSNLHLCEDEKVHFRIHAGWWKEKGRWWKKCNKCLRTLQVTTRNFLKRKNTGRYLAFCRDCMNVNSKLWREQHVD